MGSQWSNMVHRDWLVYTTGVMWDANHLLVQLDDPFPQNESSSRGCFTDLTERMMIINYSSDGFSLILQSLQFFVLCRKVRRISCQASFALTFEEIAFQSFLSKFTGKNQRNVCHENCFSRRNVTNRADENLCPDV